MKHVKMKMTVVICCLMLLWEPGKCHAESHFSGEIEFARRSMEDGFYDIAENRLLQVLMDDKADPSKEAEVHLLLGEIYSRSGNKNKALAELKMIISRFSGTEFEIEAFFRKGLIYFSEGRFSEALASYGEALMLRPPARVSDEIRYSIALCYERMKDLDAAAEMLKDILRSLPERDLAVSAGYLLSDILLRSGKYGEVIDLLTEHIPAYPVNVHIFELYYILGESHFALGNFSRSAESFTRAVRAPGEREWKTAAKYRLGEIYDSKSNSEKAISSFREAAKPGGPYELRASALIEKARILTGIERFDGAIEALNKAVRDIPENRWTENAFLLLGELYHITGSLADAEATYKQILLRYPHGEISRRARYALSETYRKRGEKDAAIEELEKLISMPSTNEDMAVKARISLAEIFQEQKNFAEAAEIYDSILRDFPENDMADRAQYELGVVMHMMGRKNAAVLALQSVVVNFPGSDHFDKVRYRLGMLYAERGDNYSALENFDKVIGDMPESSLAPYAYVKRADTLYRMERYDDVLEMYSSISDLSKIMPAFASHHELSLKYCSAWAYYRLGREDKAFAIFSDLKGLPGNDLLVPGIIFWFGEYNYGRGDFAKAREYFTKVVRDFPESRFSRDSEYWIGWSLYEDNRLDESIEKFMRLVMSDPRGKWSSQAALTIGEIYKKKGETDAALDWYLNMTEIYGISGAANIANNRIGAILKGREQYPLAIEYFRAALTTGNTESNARIQFDIAECYDKSGDRRRALEEYLKVEYMYPAGEFWVMRARVRMAELFEMEGDIENALKVYEKLSKGTGRDAENAALRMSELRRGTR